MEKKMIAPRYNIPPHAVLDRPPTLEERLIKAAKRLRRAETEYHRAIAADEQPRLSKAGTAYQCAKWNLYKVAGV